MMAPAIDTQLFWVMLVLGLFMSLIFHTCCTWKFGQVVSKKVCLQPFSSTNLPASVQKEPWSFFADDSLAGNYGNLFFLSLAAKIRSLELCVSHVCLLSLSFISIYMYIYIHADAQGWANCEAAVRWSGANLVKSTKSRPNCINWPMMHYHQVKCISLTVSCANISVRTASWLRPLQLPWASGPDGMLKIPSKLGVGTSDFMR